LHLKIGKNCQIYVVGYEIRRSKQLRYFLSFRDDDEDEDENKTKVVI
jgi:hypothetical protein